MALPSLPAPMSQFISYIAEHTDTNKALEPYKIYENKLREVFAQDRDHQVLVDPHVNTVPLYTGHEDKVKIRARDFRHESIEQKERYLLSLPHQDRKQSGAPAIVPSMQEFKTNFNLFSESSLIDLDWSNVVAAGSSVVTSLLPVQAPHNTSKRALRAYYHEKLAPASDVDLFIYGLDEKQAIEKIKQIETKIRDSILQETTTIRTKNAITIASAYPTRHVQIVLRLYKSLSEILTGFDVDCSCVAYDGNMVWASPRGIAAYMTQINPIDLARRSPSYENRLSKYSHRGFEVYWPTLERSRIDPTIFERSFSRVMGLARLLVLEKLPQPNDRDAYLDKRRLERGRPPLPYNARHRQQLHGNIKDTQPDDIAEWVEEDEVSNYHTFTVPYGVKFNAKKIEKLLFTKDLLLNAEWNRPKDRETTLHRHPAFFGSVDDVIHDCCGFCPKPVTDADQDAAEHESKIYISGDVSFIEDNPGRQTIGSFNPITDSDWTEMAYIGNTERLCQAIVDGDLEHVQDWCRQEGVDVNRRDATGRTPLQLASLCSNSDIVQCLVDNGARIVSRLVDGFTALHIAARRGHGPIIKVLLERSERNREEEDKKDELKRKVRRLALLADQDSEKLSDIAVTYDEDAESEGDGEELAEDDESDDSDHMTDASFVKVSVDVPAAPGMLDDDADQDDPDVYDVDVLAWDSPVSPLHLAIAGGHTEAMLQLVNEFGADVLLPVKLVDSYSKNPRATILTLVLAAQNRAPAVNHLVQYRPAAPCEVARTLLELGATSTQADMNQVSALHYIVNDGNMEILDLLVEIDRPAASQAAKWLVVGGYQHQPQVDNPLLTAIQGGHHMVVEKLLDLGATPTINFDEFAQAYQRKWEYASKDPEQVKKIYEKSVDQPIVQAARKELPKIVEKFLAMGVDPNTLPRTAHERMQNPANLYSSEDKSLLDLVKDKTAALQKFLADSAEEKVIQAPSALQDDETYLDGLEPGTYKHWLATSDLQQAKEVLCIQNKQYQDEVKNALKAQNPSGNAEKLEAVKLLVEEYMNLEKLLLSKGAKTFYEINPNIQKADERYRVQHLLQHGISKEPYATKQGFYVPDLTPSYKDGYFQLFEAAWDGKVEKVKELTLGPWGTNKKALQIAVRDRRGFSAFSLAILRGHGDLARIIVDIATVQYRPKNEEPRFKYSLQPAKSGVENSGGDYNDDDDDDDVQIYSELVNDQFTVDDISALADNVKSRESPTSMLTWHAPVWRFLADSIRDAAAKETIMPDPQNLSVYIGDEGNHSWSWFNAIYNKENHRRSSSLVRFAIDSNDMKLLRLLLSIGSDLAARKEDDDTSKFFEVSTSDFEFAARLGRIEMLGTIIRSTGFGIPLHKLVKTSGIEIAEKPKYYQGLSVYGKKRKDWAEAGRGLLHAVVEREYPPALLAAFQGNLEVVDYFLSDAPYRRYIEFTQAHGNDKRITALGKGKGGIEMALSTWLGMRRDLMIHLAVMSEPQKDGSNPVLDFLLQTMPESINVRSSTGMTPLHLAFQLKRYRAAEKLIAAGAHQTVRNDNGDNILHTILRSIGSPIILESILALLDSNMVKSMLIQKCKEEPGSLTPLALFIRCRLPHLQHHDAQGIFYVLLALSQGKDLEMLDGSGDCPLHYMVRNSMTRISRFIIEYNPSLLYRENATGMTPLDVSFTACLRHKMDSPPTVAINKHQHYNGRQTDAGVLGRSADAFVKCSKPEKLTDDVPGMWKMCTEMQAACPAKRKLVSLHDANEVAKQLAISQHKRKTGRDDTIVPDEKEEEQDQEDGNDEVSQWMSIAVGFRNWDLERFGEHKNNELGKAC